MPMPSDFDAVRAKCLTQTDCGDIAQRAQDEAHTISEREGHSSCYLEAEAWLRLAAAAFACEAILVRRSLSFTAGSPDEHPGPFNDGTLGMGGVGDAE